jgi:hypothetical protein
MAVKDLNELLNNKNKNGSSQNAFHSRFKTGNGRGMNEAGYSENFLEAIDGLLESGYLLKSDAKIYHHREVVTGVKVSIPEADYAGKLENGEAFDENAERKSFHDDFAELMSEINEKWAALKADEDEDEGCEYGDIEEFVSENYETAINEFNNNYIVGRLDVDKDGLKIVDYDVFYNEITKIDELTLIDLLKEFEVEYDFYATSGGVEYVYVPELISAADMKEKEAAGELDE